MLVVHGLIGGLSAAVIGVTLGSIGANLFDISLRHWLAALASSIALILGVANVAGYWFRPLELRNAETPKAWLELRPFAWAILNGGALGVGFVTRVGFWAWYLVPLSEMLSASWWKGGLMGFSYGATRTLLGPIWQSSQLKKASTLRLARTITSRRGLIYRLQGVLLLAVAAAVLLLAT